MKNKISVLLLLLSIQLGFSQKILEDPEYGASSAPITITKLEILEDATVLHFHIKYSPGRWIFIPKGSCIKANGSEEKLYVTKAVGIEIGKRHTIDSTGVVDYKLYFPPLQKGIGKIDFLESNKGGNWYVYDIVIDKATYGSLLPKELKGNWLKADGSNLWEYGFNAKHAIIEREIWNYKSIDVKRKKYTITLEREGVIKVVYAKLKKDGLVSIGNTSRKQEKYSLEKVYNPNYILPNNTEYTESLFKIDSATYTGVIKRFSSRVEQKTGTLYVNNIFTGSQETYLVKISDDGRFSVKFPISHPQSIFVRLPGGTNTAFVEPGKETFHYKDGEKSYFMGDCAKINSDLEELASVSYFNYSKTMKKIGVTSPEAYKKICLNVRDRELKALDSINEKHLISVKAYQIKKLEIKYDALVNVLGYEMQRSSIERRNKSPKYKNKKLPFQAFKVEDSFYKFITKEDISNKLSVLASSNYYFFINRIAYVDVFKDGARSSVTTATIAANLEKRNHTLSEDELTMVEKSKEIETPQIKLKENEFNDVYGSVERAFYKKYKKGYTAFSKENKNDKNQNQLLLNIAEYAVEKGDTLSSEELKMLEIYKSLKTPEELKKENEFEILYGEVKTQFYGKYKSEISEMNITNYFSVIENNMISYFGESDAFMFDVLKANSASRRLQEFKVYTDDELNSIQDKISDPFISSYIAVENEKTKTQIEINKTKGGYTVNSVDKTEADELFDSMIKKFKGKVIYVDFWATWCGPCTSGIRKITPLKEEMENKDVVFLYITNQTSPEGAWSNAITNIKGEHYRVSQDEWNYLVEKFKISGIPHYALVDKQGKIVNSKLGHNSNRNLKIILTKELNK